MSAIKRVLLAGLNLAAGVAPEAWRPYIFGLIHVLTQLNIWPGDNRFDQLVEAVGEFLEDVTKALTETDAEVLELLRLAAEVKVTRQLAEHGFLRGVGPR